MASPPPSYTSAASLSRSQASRDEMRSLADEMLRTSLSRSVTSPLSPSSPSAPPSSYPSKKSTVPRSPTSSPYPADLLNARRARIATSDTSSSASSRVSAAEAKLRVRQLQHAVERANSASLPRSTAGLFKMACSIDLLFLIDTTASMDPYIDAAKEQVKSIVADIKKAFLNESQVRVAVVGYKDHADKPNVQFLDFTPVADQVRSFLDKLHASGGGDVPEDVLGGIRQALNASWKQQTRCIIHITDAPPHGSSLHDLSDASDDYAKAGSEPHRLTHQPLLTQLIQLNINYALLRINSQTDRMALVFSRVYSAAGADTKLHSSNRYNSQIDDVHAKAGTCSGLKIRATTRRSGSADAVLHFEELQLGTTYSELRHLVVTTVTSSVSRTANRFTIAAKHLTAVKEDEGSVDIPPAVRLETVPPQWNTPSWLDETLVVEGFIPDVVVHSASTLNDMMAADENIKVSFAELTIYARSRPFAHGALRVASYARTAASTSRFVVKSFIKERKELAHLVEDMRIQALCKAFALEFNGLVKAEHPIDFVVTTCLQSKPGTAAAKECLSLEPFIEGDYVKYNSNSVWVKEDSPDDPFNRMAQAFSHFTFERSWGQFLVNDLQGVGQLLTDPAIQTLDTERFKLNPTNLNSDGFKFFFVSHECNSICHQLELKSNREMVVLGKYEFRERWPTMDPTVCCSNKLCRRLIRLASAHKSAEFLGHHWCNACWPQLQSSKVRWICLAPGPNHEFEVCKFFHESQAQVAPRKCIEHLEKDTSVASTAVVGGSLWNRMKSVNQKSYISGSSW